MYLTVSYGSDSNGEGGLNEILKVKTKDKIINDLKFLKTYTALKIGS